ncbi:hypothetical protein Taro_000485 [Colocasia esculenta]|uniref:Uncharacterized protein n=1 Tax=Colocasia esculenta TaxID=4460 RepID=A0A843TD58_COLES|nr:hypothetical protein [Colocasia esculenta]
MKGYLDSPGRKVPSRGMACCQMSDARKCCSCRRGFGTCRADVARKRGPWAEQAIRYPEAALGSRWYLNAGTDLGTLKLFLKRCGAMRKGHVCLLNWAGP